MSCKLIRIKNNKINNLYEIGLSLLDDELDFLEFINFKRKIKIEKKEKKRNKRR